MRGMPTNIPDFKVLIEVGMGADLNLHGALINSVFKNIGEFLMNIVSRSL